MAHKKADIKQVVELAINGVTYCYEVTYKNHEVIEYANHDRKGAIRDITEFKEEWLPKHVQKFITENCTEIFAQEECGDRYFVCYRYRR